MASHGYGASAYKTNAVLNAPRLKIVQMLYDEAVSSLKRSLRHLEAGEDIGFRSSVVKTQSIVGELFASLNYEEGQDIANSLASLYEFCMTMLADANANRTPSSLEAVLRVLSTLEQGWDSITDTEPAV